MRLPLSRPLQTPCYTPVGVNARPMVEGAHNIIILLALFACYPLRKIKHGAKAKTE